MPQDDPNAQTFDLTATTPPATTPPATTPPATPAPGGWQEGRDLGRYTVEARAGEGGMATVWRVRHNTLGSRHALKILHLQTDGLAAALLREGRIQANLQHPHVLPVTDVVELDDGLGLVMPWVDGASLEDWLSDRQPTLEQTERIFRGALEGLAAAHDADVVHRDIKPGNILLADGLRACLADFGIARVMAPQMGTGRRRAALMGTPAYMAPEQIEDAGSVDHRADLFSMGCVLHQLLFGRPPFEGSGVSEVIEAIRQDRRRAVAPARWAAVPGRFRAALTACLAPRPDDRPGSAREVLAILDGTPSSPPEDRSACPYRGLEPFRQQDARWMFGRGGDVNRLLARLESTRFLVVAGASGSGKSSLVQAGLVPAVLAGRLGTDRWSASVIRPGRHPMRALGSELECPEGARRLLVVDQLEELLTVAGGRGTTEAETFVDALADATARPDGTVVVATLRADFLDTALAWPSLARVLRGGLELALPPLERDQLEAAIRGPARAAGLRVEEAVVDALVGEVAGHAGRLPLLQFALRELWERREGDRLTWAALQGLGGVHGMLAHRAEGVVGSLQGQEEQGALRRLLGRLVHLDHGTAATRRLIPAAEAATTSTARRALDALVSARLVTASSDGVELAHEALLREWERLRLWLEEDRSALALRAELGRAAQAWSTGGHRDEDLWRGGRLELAEQSLGGPTVPLSEAEATFRRASLRSRADRETEAQLRRIGLRRRNVGLMWLSAGLAVAGMAAWQQTRTAERQRALAEAASLRSADALLLAAARRADAAHDHTSAVVLLSRIRSPAGRASIHADASRILGQPVITQRFHSGCPVTPLSIGPRGVIQCDDPEAGHGYDLVRAHGTDGSWTGATTLGAPPVVGWFGADGAPTGLGATLAGVPGALSWSAIEVSDDRASVVFWDDLETLGTRDEAGKVTLFRLSALPPCRLAGDMVDNVLDATWEPGGGRLLVSTLHGHPLDPDDHGQHTRGWLWEPGGSPTSLGDVGLGERPMAWLPGAGAALIEPFVEGVPTRIRVLPSVLTPEVYDGLSTGPGSGWQADRVSVSPNGRWLATNDMGIDNNPPTVWDRDHPHEPGRQLRGHTARVWRVAFSAESDRVLTVSDDRTARVFTLESDLPPVVLGGHAEGLLEGEWAGPDRVVIRDWGGEVSLWDLTTPARKLRWRHTDTVHTLRYSADGRLASIGFDGRVFRDVREGALESSPIDSEAMYLDHALTWTPDGDLLVFGTDGIRRVEGTDTVLHLQPPEPTRVNTADPEGKAALFGLPDGRVVRVDPEGSRLLGRHTGAVKHVVTSDDGHVIASSDTTGEVRIWWPEDPGSALTLAPLAGEADHLTLTPDGRWLAAAGAEHRVTLWDVEALPQAVASWQLPTSIYALVILPDGGQLFASEDARTVILEPGHAEPVGQITGSVDRLSAHGRFLIGTDDRSQRPKIWPLDDLDHPRVLTATDGYIYEVALSPDASTLAVGMEDGSVYELLADGDALEAALDARTTVCVPAATREELLGETLEDATAAHAACLATRGTD